jgi:hypothetical protein
LKLLRIWRSEVEKQNRSGSSNEQQQQQQQAMLNDDDVGAAGFAR